MIAEYVTHPSGTVHLTDQFSTDLASWYGDVPRTLCGLVVGWEADGWRWGDETLSGVAATCRRCRSILDKHNRNVRQASR